MEAIQAGGDPQVGNLATPLNSSDFSKSFIGNLPAYRPGLQPFRRGLEIGMAHGYFIYGPFSLLGPLRDSKWGNVAGLLASVGLIAILTVALSLYANAKSGKPIASFTTPNPPTELGTQEGWTEFAKAFLIGGSGGALVAFLISLTPIVGIFLKLFGL